MSRYLNAANLMYAYSMEICLTIVRDDEGRTVASADEILDEIEDPLFDAFKGSVSPFVCDGKVYLRCHHIPARTVEKAATEVLRVVLGPGELRRHGTKEAPHPWATDQLQFNMDRRQLVAA